MPIQFPPKTYLKGSAESFVREFSARKKQKYIFRFFLQKQVFNAIDFGGIPLCHRNLWINQRFLNPLQRRNQAGGARGKAFEEYSTGEKTDCED
ncbi:MAG TPA: hypothetical protein ENJ86_00355 [Methylothermaceae bacterium]|nr:hypothetical protein [Methylothermaceae bacterium]